MANKRRFKLFDTGKLAVASWINSGLYFSLTLLAVICVSVSSSLTPAHLAHEVFDFGFNTLGPYVTVVFPLFSVPLYFVLSIIAIIKNKKVFPYLLFPLPCFILWLITVGTMAVYI